MSLDSLTSLVKHLCMAKAESDFAVALCSSQLVANIVETLLPKMREAVIADVYCTSKIDIPTNTFGNKPVYRSLIIVFHMWRTISPPSDDSPGLVTNEVITKKRTLLK